LWVIECSNSRFSSLELEVIKGLKFTIEFIKTQKSRAAKLLHLVTPNLALLIKQFKGHKYSHVMRGFS